MGDPTGERFGMILGLVVWSELEVDDGDCNVCSGMRSGCIEISFGERGVWVEEIGKTNGSSCRTSTFLSTL